jgi:hypothetical protein
VGVSKARPLPVPSRRSPSRIVGREATGLIIIAILLMVLTLVRYWRYIPWNWR